MNQSLLVRVSETKDHIMFDLHKEDDIYYMVASIVEATTWQGQPCWSLALFNSKQKAQQHRFTPETREAVKQTLINTVRDMWATRREIWDNIPIGDEPRPRPNGGLTRLRQE